MENNVLLTVQGKKRKVFYNNFRVNKNGRVEYSARVREPGTGNSIRGTLVETKQGWRFRPANKDLMSSL